MPFYEPLLLSYVDIFIWEEEKLEYIRKYEK